MLLAGSTLVWAAPRSVKPQHALWLSVGGGEANNLSYGTDITPKLGAGGNVGVGYELQAGGFLLGFGVEANYQLQRDGMATYLYEDARLDREEEPVSYGYYHQQYMQQDRALRLAVPLYVGGRFGDYVYALVGASFHLPLWNSYAVSTQLLTQGTYAWSIDPVRSEGINDFSSYGFYPNADYAREERYRDKASVHARLEIGSFVPLNKTKKVQLRVGAYCNYGFRLGGVGEQPLVDVSGVNLDPHTQSMQDLQTNIRWEALNTTRLYSHLPHNLEVGIRATVLFRVHVVNPPCHCVRQ